MLIVKNKPRLLKLLDVDMEKFELAFIHSVDKGVNAKLDFIREGRVGMPVVRTYYDHRKATALQNVAPAVFTAVHNVAPAVLTAAQNVAPAAVPAVQNVAPEGLAQVPQVTNVPIAKNPPVFNFMAGSNVVINMIAPGK